MCQLIKDISQAKSKNNEENTSDSKSEIFLSQKRGKPLTISLNKSPSKIKIRRQMSADDPY